MFNKYLFAIFIMVFGVSSCNNTPSSSSGPSSDSFNNAELKVEDNSIMVVGNDGKTYNLQIKLGERISYNFPIEANKKASSITILKGNKDYYNDIALILAKGNGSVNVNICLPEVKDTTVTFHINVDDANEYTCNILDGVCAKASGIFDASNIESDIIKWLYRKQENTLSDSTINLMRLFLKELNRTAYKEYITSDNIPVVASFKDIDYKVSSNLVADYYYLYACQSEKDVEDFVEEMVSVKYESSTNTLNSPMPCFRKLSASGTACIVLVGINKDWSYQIVPAGIVCIDKDKPLIGKQLSSTNNTNTTTDFTFENRRIRIKSKTAAPNTTGRLSVDFGEFQGYGYMLNVPFTFTFSGDVQTIVVHKTKDTKETIDLTDKTSPYHITLRVGLDTGDNYIPIDAIDACGNKATYDLKIATERVENNPMIENNIYN